MSDMISKHPIITQSCDIAEICKPLLTLGISYFSHVRIDKENNFTGIGTGPLFAENYFKNKFYNADIHLEKKQLGKYIIWDSITRYGKSDEMYREGLQFGVNHVFTIVGDKNENGSNYYHFAANTASQSINQTYLTNLDLLELFILHFKESVNNSKNLKTAYDMKFGIDQEHAEFQIENDAILLAHQDQRNKFIRFLENNSSPVTKFNIDILPPQQARCLKLLLEGKTSKQIAVELGLSYRTVEHYLQFVRKKLNCRNKIELIHKINK